MLRPRQLRRQPREWGALRVRLRLQRRRLLHPAQLDRWATRVRRKTLRRRGVCAHRRPPRRHPPRVRRAAHTTPLPLGSSPCFHSAAVGAASTTRARCAVTTVPIAGRACATLAGLASTAHSICALGAALVMGGAPTRDASATRASRGATARSPHAPGTVQATARARRAGVAAMRDGLTPTVGSLLTLFGHQPPRVSGCQRATSCAKRRARHQGRLRAMDETFCFSDARRGRGAEVLTVSLRAPRCATHTARSA